MTDNFDESGTAEADPAEEMTWNDFTVPQLKEELTVRGLDTSGKKAELVERLEKYDNGTFLFQLLIFKICSMRVPDVTRTATVSVQFGLEEQLGVLCCEWQCITNIWLRLTLLDFDPRLWM